MRQHPYSNERIKMKICAGPSLSQIICTHILADNQNSQHTKNLMSAGKPGPTQGYYDESMRVDWTQDELKVN